MDCPYCEFAATRRELHRHLADQHGDRVTVRIDEGSERRFYEVRCPVCDAPWSKEIKPRLRDPRFVEKFEEEIKLVALDMLLYHIQGEHELVEQEDLEGVRGTQEASETSVSPPTKEGDE